MTPLMTPLSPKTIWILATLGGIFWGFLCFFIAKRKGRNPRGWFLLGLFFSAYAFIILLLVPSQEAMQAVALAKAESATKENQDSEKPLFNPLHTTLALRQWFYLDSNHEQVGPIDLDILKQKKSQGDISAKTYLWSEGMLDWKILDDLSYLKTELD